MSKNKQKCIQIQNEFLPGDYPIICVVLCHINIKALIFIGVSKQCGCYNCSPLSRDGQIMWSLGCGGGGVHKGGTLGQMVRQMSLISRLIIPQSGGLSEGGEGKGSSCQKDSTTMRS